jgi:hypothetical protein
MYKISPYRRVLSQKAARKREVQTRMISAIKTPLLSFLGWNFWLRFRYEIILPMPMVVNPVFAQQMYQES